MSETSKAGKAGAAKEKPQSYVVSFRINFQERKSLEREAHLAKSTISDVARDRFRMNTGLKDLHTRFDLLESAFQDVRKDYRTLVDEERLVERLTETMQNLGPDVVEKIMREGVEQFYRHGLKPTAPPPEEDDSWLHYSGPATGGSS